MDRVWLASTSPWRRRLLQAAGVRVEVEAPGTDERAVTLPDPVALARELARRKALAVAERHPGDWVIGSDQVGFDPEIGEPFGKPDDPGDHLRRLRALAGRPHVLVTGVALIRVGRDGEVDEEVFDERTTLHVRADLSDDELRAYVATGEGSGCAGGYAIEGLGAFLFERIEGDWFNVVGLPLLGLMSALRERGWRFGGDP